MAGEWVKKNREKYLKEKKRDEFLYGTHNEQPVSKDESEKEESFVGTGWDNRGDYDSYNNSPFKK